MNDMAGKVFEILDIRAGVVALPSPDGSKDGKWWFSRTVVVKGEYVTLH